MEKEKPPLREKSKVGLVSRARRLAFRTAVQMFASKFITFAVVFIAAALIGSIIQLVPWIFMRGVTDIDPLSIIIYSFVLALIATGVRYLIMRKFSRIRPYREYEEEKAEKKKPANNP